MDYSDVGKNTTGCREKDYKGNGQMIPAAQNGGLAHRLADERVKWEGNPGRGR